MSTNRPTFIVKTLFFQAAEVNNNVYLVEGTSCDGYVSAWLFFGPSAEVTAYMKSGVTDMPRHQLSPEKRSLKISQSTNNYDHFAVITFFYVVFYTVYSMQNLILP